MTAFYCFTLQELSPAVGVCYNFFVLFFSFPPLGVCTCHDMGCLPGADIVWCPTDILPVSRVSRWPADALKATLTHYTVL